MTLRPLFAWYDLWIGAYWDRANRRLYVLPLPMLGFVVQFRRRNDMRTPLEPYCDHVGIGRPCCPVCDPGRRALSAADETGEGEKRDGR